MNTTLISFVGRPPFAERSSREYTPTVYRFGTERPEDIAASFFGTALLKHLMAQDRSVRRWLLMGTHQSIWQTLLEIIPADAIDDQLAGIYERIADEVAVAGHVAAPTLAEWESTLNRNAEFKICCRIVGDGSTRESQEAIWREIDASVAENDSVVVDVTHGLRHQPIIASFMVMFLRWAKNVEQIEMFYGAFELRSPGSNFCPVLELPICAELLKASESVSTYRQTGGFSEIGTCLGIDPADLEKISFKNEMNRSDRASASRSLARLKEIEPELGPIRETLAPLFKSALHWNDAGSLAEFYARKADFAFDHGQYFQAIAMLWEGLMVAGAMREGIQISADFASRDREVKNLIKDNLNHAENRLFTTVEYLRNAILHGTDPWRSSVEADVRRALGDRADFIRIFGEGRKLMSRMMR